jgi:iduronate 2-sulfatase
MKTLSLISLFIILFISYESLEANTADRKNIVLIICDDLNDYIEGLGGHPQAKTPNIKQFAQEGISFTNAHSNNPVCAPSRSSFLTGIYPHTSKNLFWAKWYENPVLKNSKTIMEFFKGAGYHVAGTGKIMHHHLPDVWTEYKNKANYGPFASKNKKWTSHPSVPKPFSNIGAIDGSFAALENIPYENDGDPSSGWVSGKFNKNGQVPFKIDLSTGERDLTPDEENAKWASNWLKENSNLEQPFFLAVGFIRPHTPLHVPQKYFDKHPLETLQLPNILENDSDDTLLQTVLKKTTKGYRYYDMICESYGDKKTALLKFTQAYLASVSFVDDCVGEILKSIKANNLSDNTIIVFTSDHGWSMGQKDFLFKNSPWDESTRVPLIIKDPSNNYAGYTIPNAVSLIDIYPTLIDLVDLDSDNRKNENGASLDGFSLKPFIDDPLNGKWEGPDFALSMIYSGEQSLNPIKANKKKDPSYQHWSLRFNDWRYIRYNTGAEELYNLKEDPREWKNIAEENPEETQKFKKMLEDTLGQKLVTIMN